MKLGGAPFRVENLSAFWKNRTCFPSIALWMQVVLTVPRMPDATSLILFAEWWHGSLWFGHSTGPGRGRCQEFAPGPGGAIQFWGPTWNECVARVGLELIEIRWMDWTPGVLGWWLTLSKWRYKPNTWLIPCLGDFFTPAGRDLVQLTIQDLSKLAFFCPSEVSFSGVADYWLGCGRWLSSTNQVLLLAFKWLLTQFGYPSSNVTVSGGIGIASPQVDLIQKNWTLTQQVTGRKHSALDSGSFCENQSCSLLSTWHQFGDSQS